MCIDTVCNSVEAFLLNDLGFCNVPQQQQQQFKAFATKWGWLHASNMPLCSYLNQFIGEAI